MSLLRKPVVIGILTALAGGLIVGLPAGPADAVSCNSPVRYAQSSNTIYLVNPQIYTPTSIVAACSLAPLRLVDPSTKTWELSADLVLQNGATLQLHGDNAQAGPGDVDTLRIRSLASNSSLEVQSISADYGVIDADSVTVTSWDDAANGPDTNPNLPSGAPSTAQGRAFVRAQSYLDSDGTPRQSTMNITNSTFENLGYYAGESYGISYKTEGCSHTALSVCQAVTVTGSEVNSQFLNNFMGTYAWGASHMTFTGDQYANNIMYGLDTHDVSTYLDIEHDRFDYNGDHGVICSQKCDHLTIEYNESDHNGMVPWAGPTPDANEQGQVHGIMLHRGVTNSVVAYNNVHDQPNGAGIAIFDCAGDSIHDNTVTNNEYGLRLSVGAANNTFTNNTVTNSGQYAVFMYRGSDQPENTTPSGHPTGNVLSGNTFDGSNSNIIKLSEADGTVLTGNVIQHAGGSILLSDAAGTVLAGNTYTPNQAVNLTGSSTEPTSATIANALVPLNVTVDTNSAADVTNSGGQLGSVNGGSFSSSVSPTGSDMHLTSAAVGTSTITVAFTGFRATPSQSGGAALASSSGGLPAIGVNASAALGRVSFAIPGLTAGQQYAVTANNVPLTSGSADASGTLSFNDPAVSSGSTTYALSLVSPSVRRGVRVRDSRAGRTG